MNRRNSSLFRGSELPRLLLLVAILLAGWPVCLMFARSDEPQKPAPPVVPVEKITPVIPDTSIEFQAIHDNEEVLPRESAAYAKLLKKARETPASELTKEARRDIFFTHLWERPERYRGVPIHLTGTAKKILTYEVAPTMSPSERLYEVWFYSDENRSFPYVLIIQDPPAGLVSGPELDLRITVDAYFFKLMKYRAGDKYRGAPMLIGRMSWPPTPAPAPSTMSELSKIPKQYLALGVFVLFLAYMAVRVGLQVRKAQALAQPRSSLTSRVGDGLPDDQVASWLQNLPEVAEEDQAERQNTQ